ncbi:MAG: hypothetical protein KatS3mg101_1116 [Patescibacteria group bacterium]|nr:MAG: hypothetical protein KatS3mg101_1116 [Patescibacteria group bacterium]
MDDVCIKGGLIGWSAAKEHGWSGFVPMAFASLQTCAPCRNQNAPPQANRRKNFCSPRLGRLAHLHWQWSMCPATRRGIWLFYPHATWSGIPHPNSIPTTACQSKRKCYPSEIRPAYRTKLLGWRTLKVYFRLSNKMTTTPTYPPGFKPKIDHPVN